MQILSRLQALKRLRTAEFKPYVIFVKPRVPESRRRRSAATSPGGGEHGRITVSFSLGSCVQIYLFFFTFSLIHSYCVLFGTTTVMKLGYMSHKSMQRTVCEMDNMRAAQRSKHLECPLVAGSGTGSSINLDTSNIVFSQRRSLSF